MTRILLLALLAAGPALAAPTAQQIDAATYEGGPLPEGQSALTARVQALLDRAGISPGVIDGYAGGMSTSAIRAFEAREGLAVDGEMDPEVWDALGGAAVTMRYTVTEADAENLVDEIPEETEAKAEMAALGYVRLSEALAERFHMDEDFLVALNEGVEIAPGAQIDVIDPGAPARGTVARVVVDFETRRLQALDAEGTVLTNYPVAIGDADSETPTGTHEVLAIASEPTWTFDPDVLEEVDAGDEALVLAAGPNNPVGSVWIDLSKETYGIHGTPEPARLFSEGSAGCVRLTNWDAEELSEMIEVGAEVEIRG